MAEAEELNRQEEQQVLTTTSVVCKPGQSVSRVRLALEETDLSLITTAQAVAVVAAAVIMAVAVVEMAPIPRREVEEEEVRPIRVLQPTHLQRPERRLVMAL